MSRPRRISDIHPVPSSSRRLMTPRPPVAVGVGRGRSCSPLRLPPRPFSSTPFVKERGKQDTTKQTGVLDVDFICNGHDISRILPGDTNNDLVEFMEDFEKPDYAVKLESLMMATEALREQQLESIRLKHIATRNAILPPQLIQSVEQEMEAMISSLEKFSTNPASRSLDLGEPFEGGIPCPIDKRSAMVQVFENMEKINKCNLTFEETDEDTLEEYVQGLISKTATKMTAVENSIAEVKEFGKRNIELLNMGQRK